MLFRVEKNRCGVNEAQRRAGSELWVNHREGCGSAWVAPVGFLPRNDVLSSLYPLGNAPSAAFAVILSQFGQGDLEQGTDKGPAAFLGLELAQLSGFWCGGGMLLRNWGNLGGLEEKRRFPG